MGRERAFSAGTYPHRTHRNGTDPTVAKKDYNIEVNFDRAKLLENEAAWIETWAAGKTKLFLDKAGPTN